MNFYELRTIPKRQFFALLGLIAGAELLLMVTVNSALEGAGVSPLIRAMVDAGLLAIICAPFMFNYQLRPLHMAYHDNLTGLPNRLLFHDRLAQALVAGKRDGRGCAVIFMDLNRFKPINDTYGHRTGDVILKQVANRIEGCVRKSDTVARIGGDEFAILLTQTTATAVAEKVVREIAAELSKPFDIHDKHLHIGVSAGIAFYPLNGSDGTSLLDAADDAMYCAKASSGLYCFAGQKADAEIA